MSEIPTAEEVRKIQNEAAEASIEQIEEFVEVAQAALAKYILSHVPDLQEGKSINFSFPEYPDGGLFARLWRQHYDVLVGTLRRKGYWCKRHPRMLGVVLEIALRDEDLPPPPNQNSSQLILRNPK